jgi:hypothetical protein
MRRDRPMPETGPFAPLAMNAGRCADYLDSAPLGEILHEQLDYLIVHASQSCAPGCADCSRFQQVQRGLLLPFRGNPEASAAAPPASFKRGLVSSKNRNRGGSRFTGHFENTR